MPRQRCAAPAADAARGAFRGRARTHAATPQSPSAARPAAGSRSGSSSGPALPARLHGRRFACLFRNPEHVAAEACQTHALRDLPQPRRRHLLQVGERRRAVDRVDLDRLRLDALERADPVDDRQVAGVVDAAGPVLDEHRLDDDVRDAAEAVDDLVDRQRRAVDAPQRRRVTGIELHVALVDVGQSVADVVAVQLARVRQHRDRHARREVVADLADGADHLLELRVHRRFAVARERQPIDPIVLRGERLQRRRDRLGDHDRSRPVLQGRGLGAPRLIGPAVLAVRAVERAQLQVGRRQVDPERSAEPPRPHGAVDDALVQGHQCRRRSAVVGRRRAGGAGRLARRLRLRGGPGGRGLRGRCRFRRWTLLAAGAGFGPVSGRPSVRPWAAQPFALRPPSRASRRDGPSSRRTGAISQTPDGRAWTLSRAFSKRPPTCPTPAG